MLTVSATRTIDAPREEVFAFLDEPPNQVTVAPSLTGVADVQPTPDGGKRLFYGYAAFGIVFTGSLETTVYDPPARIVFRMDGDITGEIRWELESLADDQTRFTYAAEYDLSGLPGARLLRPAFRWYNRREIRTTVRNVERHVEQGPTTRADYLTDGRRPGGDGERRSTDRVTAPDSTDASRNGSADTSEPTDETDSTDASEPTEGNDADATAPEDPDGEAERTA